MEGPRPAHSEMVRPDNRYVLGTFRPQTIACARLSILRARELELPEKEEAVLDFLMSTAGLDGRAREDLRDAVAGRQTPIAAIAATPTHQGGRASW